MFRSSGVLLLTAFFVAVCATPFAFGAPGLQVIYVVPLAIVVWVLRVRTTVDAERIVVRTLLSRRVLAWSELSGFRITSRSRVRAVLTDGDDVSLPTVRTRHIPVIAALSDGRIPEAGEAPDAEDHHDGDSDPAGEGEPAEDGTPGSSDTGETSDTSDSTDSGEASAPEAADPATARQE